MLINFETESTSWSDIIISLREHKISNDNIVDIKRFIQIETTFLQEQKRYMLNYRHFIYV